MRWLAIFTVMVFVGLASHACRAESLNAYAGPSVWGPECPLKAHLGPMTYRISFKAVGKTKVLGKVTYVTKSGKEVSSEFGGSVTIRTGNFVAQPKLQFRGAPTGSAVTVRVDVGP